MSGSAGGRIGGAYRSKPELCDLPVEDRPFYVQFAWSTSHLLYEAGFGVDAGGVVGRGFALLFRSTSGVRHRAGEGTGEVVFRTCTDFDTIPVFVDQEYAVHVLDRTDRGFARSDLSFRSLLGAIEWADESFGIRRHWPFPLPGTFESLEDYLPWSRASCWTAPTNRAIRSFNRRLERGEDEATVLRDVNAEFGVAVHGY